MKLWAWPVLIAYAGIYGACTPQTCASQRGFIYDFQATQTTVPATKQTLIVRGHARLMGDTLRIDLDGAGAGTSQMSGYYMLGLERARKLLWINPKRRKYYQVAAELGKAGILFPRSPQRPFPQLKDVRISIQKLSEGPEMHGHKTVHYLYLQQMEVLNHSSGDVTHNRFRVDYYYPADIPNFVNPLMFRAVFFAPGNPPDDYMKMVKSEIDKLPQLAPFRSVYRDEEKDVSGKVKAEITVFEVSNFQTADISPNIFEIPTGFHRISPPENSFARSERE